MSTVSLEPLYQRFDAYETILSDPEAPSAEVALEDKKKDLLTAIETYLLAQGEVPESHRSSVKSLIEKDIQLVKLHIEMEKTFRNNPKVPDYLSEALEDFKTRASSKPVLRDDIYNLSLLPDSVRQELLETVREEDGVQAYEQELPLYESAKKASVVFEALKKASLQRNDTKMQEGLKQLLQIHIQSMPQGHKASDADLKQANSALHQLGNLRDIEATFQNS